MQRLLSILIFNMIISSVFAQTSDKNTNKSVNDSCSTKFLYEISYGGGFNQIETSDDGINTIIKHTIGIKRKLKKLNTQAPLYLEAGISAQYYNGAYTIEYTDYAYSVYIYSLSVPLNIVYEIKTKNKIKFELYGGVYGRINVWGEIEDNRGNEFNLFNNNKITNVVYSECNRMQFGAQFGGRMIIKRFTISYDFGYDFTELYEGARMLPITISAGWRF